MSRIHIHPGIAAKDRIRIKPRIVVERIKLTYLESRGWTGAENRYQGLFTTKIGQWHGEAEIRGSHLEFFIFDPPLQVLQGPHGACFTHIGDSWYNIHFWRESANPSDGILAIENTIAESFAD